MPKQMVTLMIVSEVLFLHDLVTLMFTCAHPSVVRSVDLPPETEMCDAIPGALALSCPTPVLSQQWKHHSKEAKVLDVCML